MKINRKLVLLLSLPLLTAAQSNGLGPRVAKRAAEVDPVDNAYRYPRLLGIPLLDPPSNSTSTQSQSTTSTSSSGSSSSSSSSTSSVTSTSTTANSTSTTTTPSTSTTPSSTSQSQQLTSYTNSAGSLTIETFTSFVIFGPTGSANSSAANSTTTAAADNSSSSSDNTISQSTIIGLSVAGGIALIGIVAFIIWKFTRKRFAGLDDFEDAIKWPEYKTGEDDMTMGPLPTRATGGAGVETSVYAPSEVDYDHDAHSVTGGSTTELVPPVSYASAPYSQPMPSQPYFDEAYSGPQPGQYYDPYRGGAPGGMGYAPGRTTSPGPQRSLTLGPDGAQDLYRTPTRGMTGPAATPPQRGASMNQQEDAGSVYATARSRSPGPAQAFAGEMGERGSPGNFGVANP
ncbi:hypothetical protein CALVIDRAFT_533576 [Calocera viscosa TUFC12733]|uniref:Mid2 domain-containing protein n=1 Tax=Calocera viscosa (strain TUFC12733) TaxID=1330018 RepID=A0A167R5G6_CALVF|nr:hypothetical protein CALVIDRAFT_533576 [Calocera viscosa TUFC12733]